MLIIFIAIFGFVCRRCFQFSPSKMPFSLAQTVSVQSNLAAVAVISLAVVVTFMLLVTMA